MSRAVKKTVRAAKGRGTLAILMLLLAGSAIIRVMSSADMVMAEARDAFAGQEETAARSEPVGGTPAPAELDAILQAFEQREKRISTQEEQIEKRLKALQIADEKINERLAELKAAEEELRSTLALASTAAEDDLARLTTVDENLKPKTASALFEEMAPEFAAGFLGRMRPDSAAAVMAGMKPESAYSISAILAGRNANVPKE